MLWDLRVGYDPDVLWKTVIQHLTVVFVFALSDPEGAYIPNSIDALIGPTRSSVLRLVNVLFRWDQTCPFEGVEDVMLHCVFGVSLCHQALVVFANVAEQ